MVGSSTHTATFASRVRIFVGTVTRVPVGSEHPTHPAGGKVVVLFVSFTFFRSGTGSSPFRIDIWPSPLRTDTHRPSLLVSCEG